MVLQTLLDFSKSWPRTISLFGIGALNLGMIDYVDLHSDGASFFRDILTVSISPNSVSQLLGGLVFVLLCYLVGLLFAFIGDRVFSIREKEDDRILREVYVFDTGNAILIRRYQIAALNAEIIFGLLVSAMLWFALIRLNPNVFASPQNTQLVWPGILSAFAVILFLVLLGWAARSHLDAIDRVLRSRYPDIISKVGKEDGP